MIVDITIKVKREISCLFKTKAQTIVERMKNEKKILIKAYENVGEFGDCLRVSIGEKKYMQQFMVALLELDK